MSFFRKKASFQKKNKSNTYEMIDFYNQLLKMEKRRKTFNVESVMRKVYPNFEFPKQK
jgi:hypothetical protein